MVIIIIELNAICYSALVVVSVSLFVCLFVCFVLCLSPHIAWLLERYMQFESIIAMPF